LVVSWPVLVDLPVVGEHLEHLADAFSGALYSVLQPVQNFVERGVILALHPVKIILEDLLFLILVGLPSELNIAVEVVRTKFTFKIGSNYNLFLTSSFEFQN